VLMNKRGEERNYGVLIAAIVAIVAIVGLIILFNKGGASGAAVDVSTPSALPPADQAAVESGVRCGECAVTYGETKVWDYNKCPRAPDVVGQNGLTDNDLTNKCCMNEGLAYNMNSVEGSWKRWQNACNGAATERFGYARYGGGYTGNYNPAYS